MNMKSRTLKSFTRSLGFFGELGVVFLDNTWPTLNNIAHA